MRNAIITLGDTDDSGKGRHFKSRFIQPGVAGYPGQFGNVLITKESFDRFINTMVGVPVIINHKDLNKDNADDERVGVVNSVWYDEKDGWYWCDGIIWDETAQNLITDKNWSVSCSYDVKTANDEGGSENNIKYDMEFLDGVFTHLALVSNPRYERANIVFNSKTEIINNSNFNPGQKRNERGEWVKDDVLIQQKKDKIAPIEINPSDVPSFETKKDLGEWFKGVFQELGSVTIADTGAVIDLYGGNAEREAFKRRFQQEPNKAVAKAFEEVVSKSIKVDERPKDADHIHDQDVYFNKIKLGPDSFDVNLYVDYLELNSGYRYAGHKTQKAENEMSTRDTQVINHIMLTKVDTSIINDLTVNFNPNVKEYERMEIENDKDQKGKWVTIKGTHVFIPDGKTVDEVIKEKGWSEKGEDKSSDKKKPSETNSQRDFKNHLGRIEKLIKKYNLEPHQEDELLEELGSFEAKLDEGLEPREEEELREELFDFEDDIKRHHEMDKDEKKSSEPEWLQRERQKLDRQTTQMYEDREIIKKEDNYKRDADIALTMMAQDYEKRGNVGTVARSNELKEKLKKGEELTDEDKAHIKIALDIYKPKDKSGDSGAKGKGYSLSDKYKNHVQFDDDKESGGYPRKIHKDLESAKESYQHKKEGQSGAEEINLKRSGKRGIPLRDNPVIVKNPLGDGYVVATVGLAQKHNLTEVYPIDRTKAENSKEADMALIEELKKLITKVENDKGDKMVENEKVDKRKLIDEVAGIMKSAGCDDEDIRTAIGKMEKIGYNDSEKSADNEKEEDVENKCKNEDEEAKEKVKELDDDVKEDVENKCKNSVDNSKVDNFEKAKEIYNSTIDFKQPEEYVSRDEKIKAAEEYFA